MATDEIGMAPGTRIGEALEDESTVLDGGSYDDEEAVEAGLADRLAPTVGLFVNDLPGFETEEVDGDTGAGHRDPLRPAPPRRRSSSTPRPAPPWPTSSSSWAWG